MSDPISDEPLEATVEKSGQRESAVMTPAYRIDGYTKWFRDSVTVFGCSRCSRRAEFRRVKFKRGKAGQSYEVTGFCRVHLPKSALAALEASMRSRVLSGPSTEGPQAEQEKS